MIAPSAIPAALAAPIATAAWLRACRRVRRRRIEACGWRTLARGYEHLGRRDPERLAALLGKISK